MDAVTSLHPTDQTLSSYGLGKLDDRLAEAVNEHLEQCPDCRKRVAEMSADSFLGRVRETQNPSGKSMFGKSQPGVTQSSMGSNAKAPPQANTLPPGLADHPDYEIRRELGRGGMGVVYLAHNRLMGRDEVLKVIGRQIMERPGVLERFLREIRAVAKLRHPNIVAAYSAVRLGESIVFGMEYVEGLDLAKMVKAKGPLPVAHACSFVHQAALGLQHAHDHGLVHRDIKPGNLMLSRDRDKVAVKVLDFGLAKVTREERVDGGLTSEGQALGTPDFIAPEQILDAPSADIRADIYSLGATLYYLLSGGPPFKANSLYDMFQAHISRDADPLNLVRPEVPVELAALVGKMMAKDPARRFQTPGEVAKALTPFFKKGNAAFKSPKADVSQAGQTNVGRPAPGAVSTPTQPAHAGKVAVRAMRPAQFTATESRWESLIELRETERPVVEAPEVAPTRQPPWKKWPITLAGPLFGLIALGVIVITIRDKSGRATKISVPDGSTVVVEAHREKVEIKPPLSSREEARGTDAQTSSSREPGKPSVAKPLGPSSDKESSATADDKPRPVVPSTPPRSMVNSIGMTLKLIPAGEFDMGTSPEEMEAILQIPNANRNWCSNEQPRHHVRITRPFYLGATEVTRGQFKRFVEAEGHQTDAERSGGGFGWNAAGSRVEGRSPAYSWRYPGFEQTNEDPVLNVSWNDAVAFCGWLSRTEKAIYRLPTEAEWEYACRAGTTSLYGSSNDPESLVKVANLWDRTLLTKYPGFVQCFQWRAPSFFKASDGYVHTAPVGQFQPNAFGLYDMLGNVAEWCNDWFDADYYKESPVDDPSGPPRRVKRVARGGCWRFPPWGIRPAVRSSFPSAQRGEQIGFRVVRELPSGTALAPAGGTGGLATSELPAEGKSDVTIRLCRRSYYLTPILAIARGISDVGSVFNE